MLNYILQVILFQVLFLVIYDLFLSKETFFTKNRWYLLSTPILSFIIPFIKIPTFQKAVPQELIVFLPEIVLSPEKAIQQTLDQNNLESSVSFFTILFWIGVIIFSLIFIIKLIKIINLIRKNETVKKADFTLILLPKVSKAFSFFRYIFLGKEIPKKQQEKVIEHELVHSKQNHSFDLLFFEFLKIVMWFNPMIYFYQRRITLVHEYISDAIVAKSEEKETYINNLLSNFFQVENISFINQFYKQSLIKKRIIMMTKNKSKKMNQLKYLLLIPVLVSMLFYTACSDDTSEIIVLKKENQKTYFTFGEKEEVKISEKKSYLDRYIGSKMPSDTEIFYSDLNKEEQLEFDEAKNGLFEFSEKYGGVVILKLFKRNKRKVIATLFDFSKMKNSIQNSTFDERTETEEVSFINIHKTPTFPGCEEGDKACFSKMVQKHFVRNFNSELPNQLGLSKGKKKVFIHFKINKDGSITDVKAKAPHEDIKNEIISVMSSLPKMIPGELKDGQKVAVNYNIPFTLLIE